MPQLATERDETVVRWQLSVSDVKAMLPEARMLEVSSVHLASSSGGHSMPAAAAAMCATTRAMEHPLLAGAAQRAKSLGYSVAVDESLRPNPNNIPSNASRRIHDLVAHLRSIGAYFNPSRRCIGLASDSAWHEAVHELVHLQFDARVHSTAEKLGSGKRGRGCSFSRSKRSDVTGSSSASSPSFTPAKEPLRTHWNYYRGIGYSELMAEEMVCREHELRALWASGAPPWHWWGRALLVWDNGLFEAERELAAVPEAKRSSAQHAEWLRVRRLRSYITGPYARISQLVLAGLGSVLLLSSALRLQWSLLQRTRPLAAELPSEGNGKSSR